MTQTVDRGTRVADLAAAADRIRHHILNMGEVQGPGLRRPGPRLRRRARRDLQGPDHLPPRGPALGRPGPGAAVHGPLRDRRIRRAGRGRHPPRRRAGHLRVRRLPAADVRDEHLHPRHGNLRRLPGPRPRRCRRDGPGPPVPGQHRPRRQHDERRRTRRGLHLGSRDGRRPTTAWGTCCAWST